MKQFSLTEWLKNPYQTLRTRAGKQARIICTTLKDDEYPIVALYNEGVEETVAYYTPNGEAILYPEDDLFVLEKKDIIKEILHEINNLNNQMNCNDFNKNFIITSSLQFIEKFIDNIDWENIQV